MASENAKPVSRGDPDARLDDRELAADPELRPDRRQRGARWRRRAMLSVFQVLCCGPDNVALPCAVEENSTAAPPLTHIPGPGVGFVCGP